MLDLDYAMAPDIYRYNNLIGQVNGAYALNHQQTTTVQLQALSEQLKTTSGDKTHYYSGIADKVGRIVNFFNTGDAALSAWEFNQLSKPDILAGSVWEYSNEHACISDTNPLNGLPNGQFIYPDDTPCPGPLVAGTDVTSRFYKDGVELNWDPTLPQPGQAYTQEQRNYLEIMGHIIPARTKSLGQVDVEEQRLQSVPFNLISSYLNMRSGFTNSNQGHSAEFHGYLSEAGRGRETYWLQVMEQGIGLKPDVTGSYSGLYPTTNLTGTQP